MKRSFILLLLVFILTSCVGQDTDVSDITPSVSDEISVNVSDENSAEEVYVYAPSEEDKMKGVWISQYDITDIWCSEEGQAPAADFALQIDGICKSLKEKGYNAIFLQVRPFGDSFYPSEYYPPSEYAVGAYGNSFEYDPLSLFVSAAHTHGLELHAWINPFRLMEQKDMELISDTSVIKQYADQGGLSIYNGRYYFRPSDENARRIILDGIKEILDNYAVDGIHFDDYFYPTKDASFDSEDFSASGEKDLFAWRRANIDSFVKAVYDLVKSNAPDCIFGIAPSGNMDYTYNTCCTDIYKWCSEEGFVDYIMPQIYFGYNHPDAPFFPMVTKWQELVKTPAVKLYIGLAAYKQGTEDFNAGEAKNEWITDTGMLFRQADDALLFTDGFVMFSYSYID